MKKIILLLLIFSINFQLFADGGSAYRYKASFKLVDSTQITGYFYITTYEKIDSISITNFNKYIKDNCHFPIKIFENIKTIKINKSLTVDFTINGTERNINKNEIIELELIDKIEIQVGSRLIEVNKNEFETLNSHFVDVETVDSKSYFENCNLYLLSWSKNSNIRAIKNEISKNAEKLINKNNLQEILKYIENKKAELIKNKIVLFEYCLAL